MAHEQHAPLRFAFEMGMTLPRALTEDSAMALIAPGERHGQA